MNHPANSLQLAMWRIDRHPTPGRVDINDRVEISQIYELIC